MICTLLSPHTSESRSFEGQSTNKISIVVAEVLVGGKSDLQVLLAFKSLCTWPHLCRGLKRTEIAARWYMVLVMIKPVPQTNVTNAHSST